MPIPSQLLRVHFLFSPSTVPLQLPCEYSNYRVVCLTFKYPVEDIVICLPPWHSASINQRSSPSSPPEKADTELGMHMYPMCTCVWRARMRLRSYETRDKKKRAVIYIFFKSATSLTELSTNKAFFPTASHVTLPRTGKRERSHTSLVSFWFPALLQRANLHLSLNQEWKFTRNASFSISCWSSSS